MHRLNPHEPTTDQESQSIKPSPAYFERFLMLLIIALVIALFAIAAWALKKYITNFTFDTFNIKEELSSQEFKLEEIESAVVNVVCPEAGKPFDFSEEHVGGTGYVLNEKGRILTNFHIIASEENPKKPMNLHEKGCFILFPDVGTGFSNDTYLAKPIHYKLLSPQYDFAYMQIYDVYSEDNEVYGSYPKAFEPLKLSTCGLSDLSIGDEVLALGYPAATEGYSLTLMKGIVSAFSSYDSFYTSANLGLGGSGGIVVSPKHNCLAGIYAGLVYDDHVSYGEVYSANSVLEFIEMSEQIDQQDSENREKTQD